MSNYGSEMLSFVLAFQKLIIQVLHPVRIHFGDTVQSVINLW